MSNYDTTTNNSFSNENSSVNTEQILPQQISYNVKVRKTEKKQSQILSVEDIQKRNSFDHEKPAYLEPLMPVKGRREPVKIRKSSKYVPKDLVSQLNVLTSFQKITERCEDDVTMIQQKLDTANPFKEFLPITQLLDPPNNSNSQYGSLDMIAGNNLIKSERSLNPNNLQILDKINPQRRLSIANQKNRKESKKSLFAERKGSKKSLFANGRSDSPDIDISLNNECKYLQPGDMPIENNSITEFDSDNTNSYKGNYAKQSKITKGIHSTRRSGCGSYSRFNLGQNSSSNLNEKTFSVLHNAASFDLQDDEKSLLYDSNTDNFYTILLLFADSTQSISEEFIAKPLEELKVLLRQSCKEIDKQKNQISFIEKFIGYTKQLIYKKLSINKQMIKDVKQKKDEKQKKIEEKQEKLLNELKYTGVPYYIDSTHFLFSF